MALKDVFSSMTNNFAEKASRFKDYGISKGGEHLARYYLRDYGQVLNFKVDTQDKDVEFELLLHGEDAPIRAELHNYAIEHEGEKSFVSFKGATTSREWIDTLCTKYFLGRRFEIPQEYARLLEKML